MRRIHLSVKGIVQGVGFRPFVYRLASKLNLTGFVCNTSFGVEIEIQGDAKKLKEFLKKLSLEKPKASIIELVTIKQIHTRKEKRFIVRQSKLAEGFTQISPDIATCEDCLKEFSNPQDRRYGFPFINCTNCGPRYSIIFNTPYDRKQTSMREFEMCPECKKEFENVYDRRFHAQPDCCFVCGPEFSLYRSNGEKIKTKQPIQETIRLLKKGKIIAIKGIGGFHIACDATNGNAVNKLRILKNRPTKPFAIMAKEKDLGKIVEIISEEKKMMRSTIAPIMLLPKKKSVVCEQVAPNNPYLGVMLAYAPVHYLLLEKIPFLVMTSANVADEPLAKDDKEIRTKLKKMVSFYLTHNREIINRCDDSVGFHLKNHGFSIIRRSRGYVPVPIDLPFSVRPTLATGPYLKNTFTLAHKKCAYVSPHIGDLDNSETLSFFCEMVTNYKRWFKIEPELIVHDLHPDYLSTKVAHDIAKAKRLKIRPVQHHITHIVSCLGENKIYDKTIGIAFDGTGYGLDGNIWGSEFFVGDLKNQKRVAHLEYLPLPGGEESIRKPYRIAIAYLYKTFGEIPVNLNLMKYLENLPLTKGDKRGLVHFKTKQSYKDEICIIQKMIDHDYNLAYTSSMGRMFDCVSAMLGITREITYEAEAAINLEYVARKGTKDHYSYEIAEIPVHFPKEQAESDNEFIIRIRPMLEGILHDLTKRVDKTTISAKFHNTVVQFSLDIAKKIRKIYGVNKVVLSGGVFQNRHLLNMMITEFENNDFKVYLHHKLPTNDGCISYGQVIVGNLIT